MSGGGTPFLIKEGFFAGILFFRTWSTSALVFYCSDLERLDSFLPSLRLITLACTRVLAQICRGSEIPCRNVNVLLSLDKTGT